MYNPASMWKFNNKLLVQRSRGKRVNPKGSLESGKEGAPRDVIFITQ